MLKFDLLHPPLLRALASAGHGSRILIADGNYPFTTGSNPAAEIVYLNVRPGLLGVDDILAALLPTVPIETATVMVPPDRSPIEAHHGYRAALGHDIAFEELDRFAFYDASRTTDVALVIASAEQRIYANLLLTIGIRLAQ